MAEPAPEVLPDGPGWEVADDGPWLLPRARGRIVALPRNGLPEPGGNPYVYRGTGVDVLAGSYGDPLLDAPDNF